jgi:hypothetical protein
MGASVNEVFFPLDALRFFHSRNASDSEDIR